MRVIEKEISHEILNQLLPINNIIIIIIIINSKDKIPSYYKANIHSHFDALLTH